MLIDAASGLVFKLFTYVSCRNLEMLIVDLDNILAK